MAQNNDDQDTLQSGRPEGTRVVNGVLMTESEEKDFKRRKLKVAAYLVGALSAIYIITAVVLAWRL